MVRGRKLPGELVVAQAVRVPPCRVLEVFLCELADDGTPLRGLVGRIGVPGNTRARSQQRSQQGRQAQQPPEPAADFCIHRASPGFAPGSCRGETYIGMDCCNLTSRHPTTFRKTFMNLSRPPRKL